MAIVIEWEVQNATIRKHQTAGGVVKEVVGMVVRNEVDDQTLEKTQTGFVRFKYYPATETKAELKARIKKDWLAQQQVTAENSSFFLDLANFEDYVTAG